MNRNARIALGVVAATLVTWVGAWFGLASHIEGRALAWIERERERGNILAYRALRIDGFPFTWRLIAEDYEIGRPLPMAQLLTGARLEATLLPWQLHDVPIRLPGRHRIERRDATGMTVIELEAARPEARLQLSSAGRIRALDVDLGDLTARVPGGAEAVKARRVHLLARALEPIDPTMREFFNLTLELDDVEPPPGLQAPFNQKLRRGEAEIGVRGDLPRGATPADTVTGWRDSGGVVELRKLTLDWAPLYISGDGTATLDRQNRPQAAFSVRVAGYAELLDALVQSRQIGRNQAMAIRAALNLVAKPAPGTGRNEVSIPITAQDGKLSILGLNLMNLPPMPLPTR